MGHCGRGCVVVKTHGWRNAGRRSSWLPARILLLVDFFMQSSKPASNFARFQQIIQERLTETVSQIFAAHLAILDDPELQERYEGE